MEKRKKRTRNPMASMLAHGMARPKRVSSAKAYSRKVKHPKTTDEGKMI